jgi:hypothetical protein
MKENLAPEIMWGNLQFIILVTVLVHAIFLCPEQGRDDS